MSLRLLLSRFAYTPYGAFGRLEILQGTNLIFTCFTLENPLKRSGGCIPPAHYTCKPAHFNRGGYNTWEVTAVPDRTHILFHIGNVSADSEGCILLGSTLGCLAGKWAVTSSKKTFDLFMEKSHLEGPVDSLPLWIGEYLRERL